MSASGFAPTTLGARCGGAPGALIVRPSSSNGWRTVTWNPSANRRHRRWPTHRSRAASRRGPYRARARCARAWLAGDAIDRLPQRAGPPQRRGQLESSLCRISTPVPSIAKNRPPRASTSRAAGHNRPGIVRRPQRRRRRKPEIRPKDIHALCLARRSWARSARRRVSGCTLGVCRA